MPAIRRVIVGVSGSSRSIPALRYAAALACDLDATLIPVHAWVPTGGELSYSRYPSGYRLDQGKEAGRQLVKDALLTAFGGMPERIDTQLLLARGEAGRVLVGAAGQAGDVLVIGSGRRGVISRLFGAGRVARYCLAHANCPVLAVPPSQLEHQAGHGLHGWIFRHRGQKLAELTARS